METGLATCQQNVNRWINTNELVRFNLRLVKYCSGDNGCIHILIELFIIVPLPLTKLLASELQMVCRLCTAAAHYFLKQLRWIKCRGQISPWGLIKCKVLITSPKIYHKAKSHCRQGRKTVFSVYKQKHGLTLKDKNLWAKQLKANDAKFISKNTDNKSPNCMLLWTKQMLSLKSA